MRIEAPGHRGVERAFVADDRVVAVALERLPVSTKKLVRKVPPNKPTGTPAVKKPVSPPVLKKPVSPPTKVKKTKKAEPYFNAL